MLELLGEVRKSVDYFVKALGIYEQIARKNAEKQTLGGVLKPSKSKEFLLEALAIHKEIGNKEGEAAAYANLESVSASNGEARLKNITRKLSK